MKRWRSCLQQMDRAPLSCAFHPLTGAIHRSSSTNVPFAVAEAIQLPQTDSHGRHILLLVSNNASSIDFFPKTDEVLRIIHAQSQARKIHFWMASTKQPQAIRGFVLATTSTSTSGSGSPSLQAVENWSVHFPAAFESIVGVATRPSNEVIQSGVKILGGGEGGYLYKYLNPNLIAVATTRTVPTTAAAASDQAAAPRVVPSLKRSTDPSVTLYLLDGVTGSILERLVYRGGEGPVHLAVSENNIVLEYFNPQTSMYELSSVELYENHEEGARGVLATHASSSATMSSATGITPIKGSVLDGLNVASFVSKWTGSKSSASSSARPFDSYSEPPPIVLTQSYTFSRSPSAPIGLTTTRRGISSKEFLFALEGGGGGGQILSIPKIWLDPRRPMQEPTPQDRMEGLVPYSANIPVEPMRLISHSRALGPIRSIVSSPVLLESTSLVCSYGLDLFCIRLNPSQTFDLLNEDFNSPFLIATVTLVIAAIFFTRRMAKAKELASAWK